MRSIKIVVLIFCITFRSISYGENHTNDCRQGLIQQIDSEFTRQVRSLPWLLRATLAKNSTRTKNSILDRCAKLHSCGPEDVALTVQQIIRETPVPQSAGYGILVGAIVLSSAVTSGFFSLINTHTEFQTLFYNDVLSTVTIITASLLVPLIETKAGQLRRLTQHYLGIGQASSLEGAADRTNARYSLREQAVTSRILELRMALKQNMQLALMASERNDNEAVSREIQDGLMLHSRLLEDIPNDDPSIVEAVYSTFFSRVANPDELFDQIINDLEDRRILDLDAYKATLKAWMRGPLQ